MVSAHSTRITGVKSDAKVHSLIDYSKAPNQHIIFSSVQRDTPSFSKDHLDIVNRQYVIVVV